MTATASEAKNFYWHCQVAATVAKLHKNPATKANLRHALRLATLTVAGKNGIYLASRKAYSEKHLCGMDWSACGLVKEHVIPISLLYGLVRRELDNPAPRRWENYLDVPVDQNRALWNIPLDWANTSEAVPDALLIAKVIKESTILAWIHQEDDMKLRTGGYAKRMPEDWDGQDPLARYRAAGIEVLELSGSAKY